MNFGMEKELDILTLIPQRPPMVMVDALVHFDPVASETTLTVREDNILVEEGRLTAYGLLENIAQTCAARIGYINLRNSDAVRIGVIGALRNMMIHSLPAIGEEVRTRIEIQEEVFGMTLAAATCRCGERLLAEGTIKIALL